MSYFSVKLHNSDCARGLEMKYMIIYEFKEPLEESLAKASEIEKKRHEKGEIMHGLTPLYAAASLPMKTYMVVDCEPKDIMKWAKSYQAVLACAQIIPVMTREEWVKA